MNSQYKFLISKPITSDTSDSKYIRLSILTVAPTIIYPIEVLNKSDYKIGEEIEAAKALLKMHMIEAIINGTWEWEEK